MEKLKSVEKTSNFRCQSLDELENELDVLNLSVKQKNSDICFLKSKLEINFDTVGSLNRCLRVNDEEIGNLKRNIREIKETVGKLVLKTKIVENQMRMDLRNDESLRVTDTLENNNRKVLILIFSYLDTYSLVCASEVCRLWRDCCLNSKLWRDVVISRNHVSNVFFAKVAKFCTNTNTIILKNLRAKPRKSDEGIECNVESGLELILHSAAKHLKTFAVIDCDTLFSNRAAWLVSNHCRHVVNFIYISNKDCINSEMIWSLGAGCRRIKTLIIPPIMPMKMNRQLTNRCLHAISTVFPYLSVLCIGGHQIDKRGLISIARHCRHLEALELDHMGQVRENTAIEMYQNGLNDLRYLYLTFTAITPKAVLQFCRNCPKLQRMVVQLNFSCYFKTASQENYRKYHKTIEHIKVLTIKSKLLYLKTDVN